MLEILVGIFIITALHCAFRDSVDPNRPVERLDDLDELFSSPASLQMAALNQPQATTTSLSNGTEILPKRWR